MTTMVRYTYSEGLREGVIFAFVNDKDEVLVEYRYDDNSKSEAGFFTNGSVEESDKSRAPHNYRLAALLREVDEELGGAVHVDDIRYLGIVRVTVIGVLFYVYIIRKWRGDMPSHTMEEGARYGRLEWKALSDYKKVFQYDSAHQVCELLLGAIK